MTRTILTIVLATIFTLNLHAGKPTGAKAQTVYAVTGEHVVAKAQQYLGRPYRRGSKGPSSFDCSGFTSYVYRQMNIRLASCSRSQFNYGQHVSKDDLQPGDLVFFSGRNSRGGVGHVGIVSDVHDDGSFSFIHASCSRGVTVSSINEPYYSKRYRGARRMIDDGSDFALNR